MRKTMLMGAGLMALVAATPGQAAILLSTAAGSATYTGPTPTYTFETPAPLVGGQVGTAATRPLGSTGNFATFGPSYNGNGVLDLSSFGNISSISFIWGSVDSFNSVQFLNAANGVLETFTGNQVYASSQRFGTPAQRTNPLVTFTLTGASGAAVNAIRFLSTRNGFEIDNVAVQVAPVPEPATWAMMLLGFGAIGFGLRRSKATTKVSFA